MPANRLPTSAAVGRFLGDHRRRLGYTLRDVEALSGGMGNLIPFSTLARIEQGRLDPGLRRLQQLLRVYHVPLQVAGDLLDLEDFVGELPEERVPERLYQMGREASRRGDSRAAVAAFIALNQLDEGVEESLRQKAILALSATAGSLGKYEFAKYLVDDLLVRPPHPSILVSVLVQAARCWQWLGSAEVALALVERAESHLSRRSPTHQRAFVFHEKASVLATSHRFESADAALRIALSAYRGAEDHAGYCRALGVRVRMEFERNRPSSALLAAQSARMYAQRHGFERLRLLYSIEEARSLLALGKLTACLSQLGQVLAVAVGTGDKVTLFYTHFYYWKAYERSGDTARAKVELESAVRHLEFLDEVTREVAEVRKLLARRKGSRRPKARED